MLLLFLYILNSVLVSVCFIRFSSNIWILLQLYFKEKNGFGFVVSTEKCPDWISSLSVSPQLLLLRGYAFNHSADFETVRMMKEKLCYVGYNIEQEQKLALETTVLVESYTVSSADGHRLVLAVRGQQSDSLRASAVFTVGAFTLSLWVCSCRTVGWLKWAASGSRLRRLCSSLTSLMWREWVWLNCSSTPSMPPTSIPGLVKYSYCTFSINIEEYVVACNANYTFIFLSLSVTIYNVYILSNKNVMYTLHIIPLSVIYCQII